MTAIMWAVLALACVVGFGMIDINRRLEKIAKTLEALEELLSEKLREGRF